MAKMLTLDGTMGCGGGHLVRTALSLSAASGVPVTLSRVRMDRKKPGLLRHHLSVIQSLATICGAQVEGAYIGSQDLVFTPGAVQAGAWTFQVGMSRSALMLLGAVLPALLRAPGPSSLVLEGGTHTVDAPVYEFWELSLAPMVARMGAELSLSLASYGFAPAGGGCVKAQVSPLPAEPADFVLEAREEISVRQAEVVLAQLRRDIAERELDVLSDLLSWPRDEMKVRALSETHGPGNVVVLSVKAGDVCEVTSSAGRRGVRAEQVSEEAAHEMRRYLASSAPVGRALATWLVPLLAVSPGVGRLKIMPPSEELLTTAELVERILRKPCTLEKLEDRVWSLCVGEA